MMKISLTAATSVPTQLRVSMVMAEVGAAMIELAENQGAIFRLGLSMKHLAGIFEMTGQDQQQGLGEVLQAVKNAREEARVNPRDPSSTSKEEAELFAKWHTALQQI
ncbi:hypothetical protein [Janthinobacterium sp. FW305-128]|uniref:hypothetical protein n=1 Tax=Janthinobacterium sp. FW305-128 TaxID=2775055 RepID=UPI001E621B78|nr:hypothetical protein [Janthinobacterium sp. FW305-128]MCC7684790.1 hypothetical protein [Janthinobacterium sp. FW305-128]